MNQTTLGEVIRDQRVAKGFGLRELAKTLEITPSYLSDIENDRRVPSEDVLAKIAKKLDLNLDTLMALGGRFGDDAERYMKRHPTAGVLFRRITEGNLQEPELQKLLKEVEDLNKKTTKGGDE
jgi:transcriptional regulator with XRE-family HTH domain